MSLDLMLNTFLVRYVFHVAFFMLLSRVEATWKMDIDLQTCNEVICFKLKTRQTDFCSPILLPTDNWFYPSKWWINRSLIKLCQSTTRKDQWLLSLFRHTVNNMPIVHHLTTKPTVDQPSAFNCIVQMTTVASVRTSTTSMWGVLTKFH